LQGNEVSSVKRLIVGTFWSGFWILPVLLGLYLVTPFFNYLIKKFNKYFFVIYLLVMGVLLTTGIPFPLYFEYSFYFILGYVLTKVKISKQLFVFSSLGLLFSWLLISVLTYQLSVPNNGFVAAYYHYNTWPVVLLSIFGFMSLRSFSDIYKKKLNKKSILIITNLSRASFGIYFIHMLFLRAGFNLIYFPSYIFIPIFSIGIYFLSYVGIRIIKKSFLFGQIVS